MMFMNSNFKCRLGFHNYGFKYKGGRGIWKSFENAILTKLTETYQLFECKHCTSTKEVLRRIDKPEWISERIIKNE